MSIAKRLLLANTIITADGHFAFVNNYKAGCSAVAHLLYLYDHGRTAETSVHGGLMKGVMAFPTQAVSFSTVRHPEHRAISCYFNFFVTNANPVAQRHTEKVARFGFYSKEDLHYSFDVFLEYVRANFEISGLRCDGHFRAQNLNPGYRLVTLSDIAKLETPDAHCQTWVL